MINRKYYDYITKYYMINNLNYTDIIWYNSMCVCTRALKIANYDIISIIIVDSLIILIVDHVIHDASSYGGMPAAPR